jgi:hypothetical protein
VTQPTSDRAAFSGRRKPTRGPVLPFVLISLVLVALVAAYTLARPRLVLANRLFAPVRVTVGDRSYSVAAGQSVDIPTSWRKDETVIWELIRPLSADGKPMGEAVRGSLAIRGRWGAIYGNTAARGMEGNYFAPLITNASNDLLRVTVNAGLEGAVDCGCAVRPDARRAFIGYYRLYVNSTVQAKVGDRSAVFTDLGPKVVSRDGTIGLRFSTEDLRAR